MVDFELICSQLGIQFWRGGKNNIPGCLTIHCPCCPENDPDPSRHGNLDPVTGKYSCWRCKGSHPAVVIARAGHVSVQAASDLIRKYTTGDGVFQKQPEQENHCSSINLPGSSSPLDIHRSYLERRGFDVGELIFYHGIRFTGMLEKWEGVDWGFRTIIPVVDSRNHLVSFQGRDVTGRSPFRYLFPPKEKQIKDCKTLLYGEELCGGLDSVLVVEGVMDMWKLGRGAVCTFGSSVTPQQVLRMSKFKRVYLAFDNEPAAKQHSLEIAKELSSMGTEAYLVDTDFGLDGNGAVRDIGDLSLDDARAFKGSVLRDLL